MHMKIWTHVLAAYLDIRVESRQQLGFPELLRTSHTLLQMLDFLQNSMTCWHRTSQADKEGAAQGEELSSCSKLPILVICSIRSTAG